MIDKHDDIWKRIWDLEDRMKKLERDMKERHVNLYERLEKLEKVQETHYANAMDAHARIDKLEESFKPTGFKEYKSSGWEGVKRESKGVEDKRGYTGW